jgi:site-specific DNA recombinase
VENTPEGKVYRKQKKTVDKPRNEWIAVPVPDASVPRELVDAARAVIKNNRGPSSADRRFWELSGGLLYCGGCGRQMVQHSTTSGWYSDQEKRHFYYRCRQRWRHGRDACENHKMPRADKVEARVWDTVSSLLKDPDQLRADLDKMIALERSSMHGDPEREQKTWLDKLAEVDCRRARYQEMAAEDLITFDELRARLAEIDGTRRVAEGELEALRNREERITELEADRDALLGSLAEIAPTALASLAPEECHQVYKMLKLRVIAYLNEALEGSGAFVDGLAMCALERGSGFRSDRLSWATSSTSTSALT